VTSKELRPIFAKEALPPRRKFVPLLGSLRDIADFPGIGRRQSVEGIRKYVARDRSYLV
jgi:hypothetical protein